METFRAIRSAAEFVTGSIRLVITQLNAILIYGEDTRYRGFGSTRLTNRKNTK